MKPGMWGGSHNKPSMWRMASNKVALLLLLFGLCLLTDMYRSYMYHSGM